MNSLKTVILTSVILLFSFATIAGFFYFKANKRMSAEIPVIKPGVAGDVVPASFKKSHNMGRVLFSDYTERSGIDFLHHQAEDVIDSLPQVMGSGVCMFDYNSDGNMDVYLVNGSGYTYYYGEKPWWYKPPANVLYRNNGNGRFTDVTKQAGVGHTGWGMGCAAADYNNDGYQDIYVTYYGKNILYKNNGNGTFMNVADKTGVDGKKEKWSTSAAWADYDNDGWLDLYVVNYIKFDKYMNPGEFNSAYQMPTNLLMNSKIYTGSANILFHNNKDGTFTDVTKKAGVEDSAGKGLGVIFCDLDNDGDADIYVVNDGARNVLFINNGNGAFTDIGGEAGVDTPLSGMGVAAGDYDNDGDFDIFATYPASETNILYRNMLNTLSNPPISNPPTPPFSKVGMKEVPPFSKGDKGGFAALFSEKDYELALSFKDVTVASGLGEDVSIGFFGWGTDMFDYDNDGYPDIFVANGNPNPDFDNPRTTVGQRNQLFRNNGSGIFTDVSGSSGDGLKIARSSRGATFGDIDNDGDIDIVVNNNNNYASVLRNDGGNSGNYLTIRLKGTKNNRDGIGAKVSLTAGSLVMLREVRAGSGYLSQNDTRLHFGMDEVEKADKILIQWPSGITQLIKDVAANQFITVTEGTDNFKIEEKKRTAFHDNFPPLEKTILTTLADPRPSKKIEAMRSLRDTTNEEIIDKAIEPVMMSLNNRDKDVRKEAADLLCKLLKDEQTILRTTMLRKRLAVVPLLKALDDPEADVRVSVVKALGYSESYRAIIPVADMLKDHDKDVRREAALALGWLKNTRGIEPLLEILRNINEYPSVRASALLSLVKLESDVTVSPLLEQLHGKDEKNKIRAMEVLQAALTEDETVLLNRKPFVQPLTELLNDPNTEIKCAAIKTITLIRDTSVVPLLISTLSDKSKEVRTDVIKGLGELRDKRATTVLVSLLNDKDEDIRLSVLKSLGLIIDKETIPVIFQIIKDKNENKTVRISALDALQQIDPFFWDKNSAQFIEDDLPEIRIEAIKGIGSLHEAQSADLLLHCLQNDKDNVVRKEVITALGYYKERKVVDSLISIIKSRNEEREIRFEAMASLVRIGDERAVIHIEGIARNSMDELRSDAEEALERFR
ncbi:MAG TPA: hypothetical protein DCR39_06340 [Nitrospiraceae bacterium]|nr:hypothetical protein [Nitrospiraceae bacterium]